MWKALLCVLVFTSGVQAAPTFDSSYTRFASDCEELLPPTDEGGDPVLRCKGPAGLGLRIDFSAADAALNAVLDAAGNELAMGDGVMGIDTEKGVVEWRLADGKPVAIIVRSTPVVFDDNGGARPGPEQTLEIRGLGALEGFSDSLNTRTTPKANELARLRIEAAFAQRP